MKPSPSTPPSEGAIAPGDFVVVIRGCCDRAMRGVVGLHATVLRLYNDHDRLCIFCNSPIPDLRAELDHLEWNSPVSWLKKIPPIADESLAEDDSFEDTNVEDSYAR